MTKCFLSYSWDSDDHRNWVRSLATKLQENGVYTHLDQWDVKPGIDLAHYMETSIRESSFVLLMCTQRFCDKANAGAGGVGYEKTIVTGELFSLAPTQTKFVPLLCEGNPDTSLPSYLKSRAYIDFRSKNDHEVAFEQLLRHLLDAPSTQRPSLGSKPQFASTPKVSPQAAPVAANAGSKSPKPNGIERLQSLISFAYSGDGLDMPTKEAARTWALNNLESFSLDIIAAFQRLRDFAYSGDGLDFPSKEAARNWALDNLQSFSPDMIDKFYLARDFAYSGDGLDLPSKEAARNWALNNLSSFSEERIQRFATLRQFAYSGDGLDLPSKQAATQWALDNLDNPNF